MSSISEMALDVKRGWGDQLNGRIEKAINLVNSHRVEQGGGNTWTVQSQTEPWIKYLVIFDLNWHCTCQDVQNGAPEVEFCGGVQKTCKHILAAGIYWATEHSNTCGGGK